MNCFQHRLTIPAQMLLALLEADAAHLGQERRELIRLRDQVRQAGRSHEVEAASVAAETRSMDGS
ncbi:hypothetical protein AYJ54_33060 [Bradyrhizobium centrolobii]|uniref:Uncharacterized protein n=1 Tax=Bradyrhizobium centrolobii TaxID=1505087 RepID=A0A176Y7K6_9BRAD|nr:hypothetical protein AYJ54_33060 [Bradyrhizobium centrolobii]